MREGVGPSPAQLGAALGHTFVEDDRVPYAQTVMAGDLVLHNESPLDLERLTIRIETGRGGCTLSVSPDYVARLDAFESTSIAFRLSTLEACPTLRCPIDYDVSGRPGVQHQEWHFSLSRDDLRCERERRIFVSYATKDYERIRPLLAEVRRHGRLWIDRAGVGRFEWFAPRIRDALSEATLLVVFLSRWSVESRWVLDEIQLATWARASNHGPRVVVAQLEACGVPIGLESIVNDAVNVAEEGARRLGEAIENVLTGPSG